MEKTILATSALHGKAYLVLFPVFKLTDILYSVTLNMSYNR